jgi:hypothetical protein
VKMSENKDELRLERVAAEAREPLAAFCDAARPALGGNVESITVVGSSLTPDFRAGRSDINTVLVVGRRTLEALNAIAALAGPMRRRHISAPLLMTSSYIARSTDVFGVEFLDFQHTHETILGDDPFAPLCFEKKDVRLQCERELKATLIRLRQGYIAAAGNRRLVRDILISAAKAMGPLLRGMLWLTDSERPHTAAATLQAAGDKFSVDTNALASAASWRHRKVRLAGGEIEGTFEAVYTAVEKLALLVDELEV